MRFSASLGFLFTEHTFCNAIRAAKQAGFDAVECHWPYHTPAAEVKSVLDETRLPMLGLNTVRGSEGENGLSALVGREAEARAAIDQALAYAADLHTPNIHVMAGSAIGDAAHRCFVDNLSYACKQAAKQGATILIEPLNRYDAPDYFLQGSEQAVAIINEVGMSNLKLMFDCYHLQIMEGDLTRRLERLLPVTGHIQIASVPYRSEPDQGELNYAHIFRMLEEWGYKEPIGAEYKPATDTVAGLDWLRTLTA